MGFRVYDGPNDDQHELELLTPESHPARIPAMWVRRSGMGLEVILGREPPARAHGGRAVLVEIQTAEARQVILHHSPPSQPLRDAIHVVWSPDRRPRERILGTGNEPNVLTVGRGWLISAAADNLDPVRAESLEEDRAQLPAAGVDEGQTVSFRLSNFGGDRFVVTHVEGPFAFAHIILAISPRHVLITSHRTNGWNNHDQSTIAEAQRWSSQRRTRSPEPLPRSDSLTRAFVEIAPEHGRSTMRTVGAIRAAATRAGRGGIVSLLFAHAGHGEAAHRTTDFIDLAPGRRLRITEHDIQRIRQGGAHGSDASDRRDALGAMGEAFRGARVAHVKVLGCNAGYAHRVMQLLSIHWGVRLCGSRGFVATQLIGNAMILYLVADKLADLRFSPRDSTGAAAVPILRSSSNPNVVGHGSETELPTNEQCFEPTRIASSPER